MQAYKVKEYSFREILKQKSEKSIDLIAEVERLASMLFRPKEPHEGADCLLDEIKYRDLIECDYGVTPDFGRVFLAQPAGQEEYVGFALCFDDLFRTGKSEDSSFTFPLMHCEGFFQHDLPYLNDLAVLKDFAYCFQLGVTPSLQGQGCSNALLDAFELYYSKKNIVLLAASIHQSQQRIIWRLKNRNKNVNRHAEHQLDDLDFSYQFLDHYFDDQQRKGLWFRVIQILNNDLFVKKINYLKLPKAYNTIIPIQLNQAAISVNKIIGHLGAKLLWSSLFNANNLLVRRYGMAKDNHGFFSSLIDASTREKYEKCTKGVGEITNYLRDKVNPREDVVSLTESFKDDSYELFFFENEIHPMRSFNNARCLSLKKEEKEKSIRSLIEINGKENVYRGLTEKEKDEWVKALYEYLKEPSEAKMREWQEWKLFLSVSDEEEALLKVWVAVWFQHTKRSKYSKEDYEKGRSLVKSINDRHDFFTTTKETRNKWAEFLHLHEVLYDIDTTAMESPDNYWWCHAMVPISYAEGKNVVGVMFSYRCLKLPESDPEFKTRMNNLADLICSALSRNMLGNLIKFQRSYALENGHRFSIAAVTSRNLAHNLGSHILANLDTVAGIEKLVQEMPSSFIEELARFNSFIRTKTHHLADMVTSEPVSTVDKWLKQEVLHQFNNQKIVKRFLSGTKITDIFVHYRGIAADNEEDIKVQVPNGDLGVAAFSMILENIVRNTAKYESQNHTQKLDISVEVFKQTERGYHLRIYDHVHRPQEELKELVRQINKLLEVRIFLTDYRIRPSGWGLTEMRAAAAYLRKKVPGLVLGIEEEMKIPFISAHHHRVPDINSPGQTLDTMAYEIYLKRPRNIVIVNYENIFSGLGPEHFQEYGIKIISPDSLRDQSKDIYSHSFIIYFDENVRAEVENLKRLPLRWVSLDGAADALALRELFRGMTGDEILKHIWSLWLMGYCSRKGFHYGLLKFFLLQKDDNKLKNTDSSLLKQTIVYDDHGRYLPAGIDKHQLLFYHSFSSVSPLGRIIKNNLGLSPLQKEVFNYQLIEAAVTEVIIIDERIQRDLTKTRQSPINEVFEHLRRARIYIPNPKAEEVDLLQIKDGKELADWLTDSMKRSKIDFIVLHLGLLESLISSKMEDIDYWINKNIRELDNRPEIVLISGRGKPHHFPSSISFQPANIVAENILEGNLSKYHLVQTLFSSRTRIGI